MALVLVDQLAQRLNMTLCQIDHMNIVSNAGPIRGVIIVAKDPKPDQIARCDLGNVRHQVVGYIVGIFTNKC